MFDPALTRSKRIMHSQQHSVWNWCVTDASHSRLVWNPGTLETRDPLFVSTLFLGHELKVWYPNKRNTYLKQSFEQCCRIFDLFGGCALRFFSMTQGLKSHDKGTGCNFLREDHRKQKREHEIQTNHSAMAQSHAHTWSTKEGRFLIA